MVPEGLIPVVVIAAVFAVQFFAQRQRAGPDARDRVQIVITAYQAGLVSASR